MDKIECVMDAELFKKFGLYRGELCERLKDNKALHDDFECLTNLLAEIGSGKCRACYNEKIRKEYFSSDLPIELLNPLALIISTEEHHKDVDELDESFDPRVKDVYGGRADLQDKLHYILVASVLHRKLIVSSSDDFERCYCMFRLDLLSSFGIDCKKVCETLEEVRNHANRNQHLNGNE